MTFPPSVASSAMVLGARKGLGYDYQAVRICEVGTVPMYYAPVFYRDALMWLLAHNTASP
ncbi:hypothetical protein DWG24_11500 [Dickeya zeae]|uniref:Uncharacterized protein n=1 Tax=Dickeya zeae TaxID=204042 RepID=A0AAE6YZW3_9GAMM|nr:hypothetical protein DWG24_11500 [Dickeya zeae]